MIFDVEVRITSDNMDLYSDEAEELIMATLDGHGLLMHYNNQCIVALDIEAETSVEAKKKALDILSPLGFKCRATVEGDSGYLQEEQD